MVPQYTRPRSRSVFLLLLLTANPIGQTVVSVTHAASRKKIRPLGETFSPNGVKAPWACENASHLLDTVSTHTRRPFRVSGELACAAALTAEPDSRSSLHHWRSLASGEWERVPNVHSLTNGLLKLHCFPSVSLCVRGSLSASVKSLIQCRENVSTHQR